MVRARVILASLDYVARVEPAELDAVCRYFPPDVLREIESGPKTAWIPIEKAHYLTQCWDPVFGRARAVEILTGIVLDLFRSPMLGPIVTGAVRVMGTSPASFVKLIPRAWNHAYRDFSRPQVSDAGDGSATVVFEQMPAQVFQHPGYFLTWSAALRAICRLCERREQVEWTVDEKHRRVTYDLRWDSPSTTTHAHGLENQ